MAADSKSPIDHALDLVVFAPVGLVLTAKDELPGLIEKGRQRLGSQVFLARMVGQLAAAQGQRMAAGLVDQLTTAAGRIGGLPPTVAAPEPRPESAAPTAPSNGSGARNGNGREGAADPSGTGAEPAVARRPAVAPPAVDTLAIPGYDSLAASQVVQRLAGLSGPELDAVRRYELAMRGRRTILSKVAQLEAERSASDTTPRS